MPHLENVVDNVICVAFDIPVHEGSMSVMLSSDPVLLLSTDIPKWSVLQKIENVGFGFAGTIKNGEVTFVCHLLNGRYIYNLLNLCQRI